MINSIYDQCKKFMKKDGKIFLIYIVLLCILSIPLPYYINKPGGAIDIKEKVQLENAYEAKGGFYYGYVSEVRATLPLYLYTFINKDWELIKKEEMTYDEESIADANLRSKILMKETNSNAIIVSYQKAKKTVEIKKEEIYVTYIDPKADTDLKIGDQILEVDEKNINSRSELFETVQSALVGTEIKIKVKRGKKEVECFGKLQNVNGVSLIGIVISSVKEMKTDPSIQIVTSKNESGPSGGLMLSLTIYNMLTKKDLTKGYKIVGTGTMEEDGSVGEIGGVSYKLKGAVKKKADIFLVPSGNNYEEAMKLKKERNYKIEIKAISTFDEAIEYLENLE